MIAIAQNIYDFFKNKPDTEDFQKTVDAFKYLARINLITDSYRNYKRFRKTFPESKYIAKILDKQAFSTRGRIRFELVRHGLAPVFILIFKIKNLIQRSK